MLVRDARTVLRMSQSELGEAMSRTRHWVAQLEKGVRYGTGEPFEIDSRTAVQLALVLGVEPPAVLSAAGIPPAKWPDLSNIVSSDGSVRTVDITTLSPTQADLVQRLVDEFKAGNHQHETD